MRRSDTTDPVEFSQSREEQARDDEAKWTVLRVSSDSANDTARSFNEAENRLRKVIREELAALKPTLRKAQVPAELTDNTFVHQDSRLYDREVFLRAARSGGFPTKTIGKKVMARWADVRAAFSPPAPPEPESAAQAEEPDDSEDLARLAASFGLVERKGRSNGS